MGVNREIIKIEKYTMNWYEWKPSIISLKNIAKIGMAIPNILSFIKIGAIIAEANIGVKLGGWGIILDIARISIKKIR